MPLPTVQRSSYRQLRDGADVVYKIAALQIRGLRQVRFWAAVVHVAFKKIYWLPGCKLVCTTGAQMQCGTSRCGQL